MIEGRFFWYDTATDVEAAAKFYAQVLGGSATNGERASVSVQGRDVIGFVGPGESTRRPHGWRGYVLVENVDAMVGSLIHEGGKLLDGPVTAPSSMRYATVADPQGVAFVIATPDESKARELGHEGADVVGWHELHSAQWTEVLPFYEKLFGWRRKQLIDMGIGGTAQFFSTPGRDEAVGSVLSSPGYVVPSWRFYFAVDAIELAAARVRMAGGSIRGGPQPMASGKWCLECKDPCGTVFWLVSAQR